MVDKTKKPAPVDADTPPMTPEMKQAKQEAEDAKMREKMKSAYDKANVNKGYKKGGKVTCMSRGGGCEVRGKTKGRIV